MPMSRKPVLNLLVALYTCWYYLLVHSVLREGISYVTAIPISKELVLHLPVTLCTCRCCLLVHSVLGELLDSLFIRKRFLHLLVTIHTRHSASTKKEHCCNTTFSFWCCVQYLKLIPSQHSSMFNLPPMAYYISCLFLTLIHIWFISHAIWLILSVLNASLHLIYTLNPMGGKCPSLSLHNDPSYLAILFLDPPSTSRDCISYAYA